MSLHSRAPVCGADGACKKAKSSKIFLAAPPKAAGPVAKKAAEYFEWAVCRRCVRKGRRGRRITEFKGGRKV